MNTKTYIRGKTLVSAQAATGIGAIQPFLVSDYSKITVSIESAATASLTVKCKGSIGETAPTFTSAAAVTNPWTPIQMINLDSGLSVDGSTGVVLTGTDICNMYEVNVSNLDWLAFDITAYAAGNLTIRVSPAGTDS